MRTTVNTFVGQKLKFKDVQDHILFEEIHMMDSGKVSTNSTFNVEKISRNQYINILNKGISKSSNVRDQSKSR